MNILLSYPNSGRTWVSSILSSLGVSFSISHVGSHIKEVEVIEKYLKKYPNKFSNYNIVFLTRELKDQLVSNYCQMKFRLRLYSGELSEFIRNEKYGAKNLIKFNILMTNLENTNSKLIISYEELIQNTELNIKEILSFYNINYEEEKLKSVIEYYSFENMHLRELNKIGNKRWYDITNINNQESFKSRKGIVGGYVDYMTNEDIQYCDHMLNMYK